MMFEKLKKLHLSAFGAGEEGYINQFLRYFDDKESDIHYINDSSEIVSALYILRKNIVRNGVRVPVAFISGVATLPAFRGRGLARRNITDTLISLAAEGVAVALLVPSDPVFYAPLGFTYVSRCVPYSAAEEYSKIPLTYSDAPVLATLHIKEPFCLERTASDFKRRIDEFAACGGCGYLLCRESDGAPAGYLFGGEDDYECHITGTPRTEPFGMARICDAKAALRMFPLHEDGIFAISDPLIAANNIVPQSGNTGCPSVNISDLTKKIFGGEFFMSDRY